MKLLPMLVFGLLFLFLGIMVATAIGLPKGSFRNLFVLCFVLWGVLIGWKVTLANKEKS
ncbi:MAG: hypothetical protein HYX90_03510 [Chloroflexi bacterium]|nr:hypothetical protein [Chloroflexota bacterium]